MVRDEPEIGEEAHLVVCPFDDHHHLCSQTDTIMEVISSGMSTPIKLAQDAASAVVNAVGSVAGPIATEAGSEAHRVSSARVPPRESALSVAAA